VSAFMTDIQNSSSSSLEVISYVFPIRSPSAWFSM
jgi:hypothetical protein